MENDLRTVKTFLRLLPWLVLVGLAVGLASWARRDGDFAGYVTVGHLVMEQRHIYLDAPPGINTWPPLFSVFCVPLALFDDVSHAGARVWWIVGNYALLWFILRALTRLVYHRSLSWNDTSSGGMTPWSVAIAVPVILTHRFILGNFDHLQINIVIFALTLGGLYLGFRRQPVLGGLSIGTAIALKVMPIVFVPYLAYRRQWRLAAVATASAIALSISPALLWGRARLLEYFAAWQDSLAFGWGVGKMNQSVLAMFDRLIGHGMVPFHTTVIDYLPESGTHLPAQLTMLLLGLTTVAALALFRGPWRLDSSAGLIEVSVVFLVGALFGPLTWKAYLVVLLCPMLLLVRLAQDAEVARNERRTVRAVLWAFFVMASVATPGILGKRLGGALEMLSITTWSTLLILVLLFWLRYRHAAEEAWPEAKA